MPVQGRAHLLLVGLAAIEEATTIRRQLAAARPDAFQPDLATALSNQSNGLPDLGRREEALAGLGGQASLRRFLAHRPERKVGQSRAGGWRWGPRR